MYTVCTVRLRPIRARKLAFANMDDEIRNTLVRAEIRPWGDFQETAVLRNSGNNPIWSDASEGIHDMDHIIDLPYPGHPYSGVIPKIVVSVVSADFQGSNGRSLHKKIIGNAEIDLREYLSKKNQLHPIEVLLNNGNFLVGSLECTLEFVLVGSFEFTIFSGEGIRSNEYDNTNIEPYIRVKLAPEGDRFLRTDPANGTNPIWRERTQLPRKSTMNFISSFSLTSSKNIRQSNRRNEREPNNTKLEFDFHDFDPTQQSYLIIEVFDDMNTTKKKDIRKQYELENMTRIENKIKELKGRSGSMTRKRKGRTTSAISENGGAPKILSNSVGAIFKKTTTKRRVKNNKAKEPKRNRNSVQEVKVEDIVVFEEPQQNTPVETEVDDNLSDDVKVLMKQLKGLKKQFADPRIVKVKDRNIGSATLKLEEFLNFSGIESSDNFTLNIRDNNDLSAGSVHFKVSFKNAAVDPTKEVLQIPQFSISNLSFRNFFRNLRNLNRKDIKTLSKNIYIFTDINLELYAPKFIIKTSHETGVPKVIVTFVFVFMVSMLIFSTWKGLGTEFISYLIEVLYPTYQSYKALESKNGDRVHQWLTYWVIYGMFNFLEKTIFVPFVFVYPTVAFGLKILLFWWLTKPSSPGALFIYQFIIVRIMKTYEKDVDGFLRVVRHTTKNMVTDVTQTYQHIEAVADRNSVGSRLSVNSNGRFRRASLDFARNEDRLDVSKLQNTLRLMVAMEGHSAQQVDINLEQSMKQLMQLVCGQFGIRNYQDYDLCVLYQGQKVRIEEPTQLTNTDIRTLYLQQKVNTFSGIKGRDDL